MPTPRKYNTAAGRYAAYRQRKRGAMITELQERGLPTLPEVPTIPGTLRWLALTEQARHTLKKTHDEMESYQQSRSERWQQSQTGRIFHERLEKVSAILEKLAATPDILSDNEG
jgi:hypothetical protein